MHNVYEYVVDNQGIDTEASYPYKGRVSACERSSCDCVANGQLF